MHKRIQQEFERGFPISYSHPQSVTPPAHHYTNYQGLNSCLFLLYIYRDFKWIREQGIVGIEKSQMILRVTKDRK